MVSQIAGRHTIQSSSDNLSTSKASFRQTDLSNKNQSPKTPLISTRLTLSVYGACYNTLLVSQMNLSW